MAKVPGRGGKEALRRGAKHRRRVEVKARKPYRDELGRFAERPKPKPRPKKPVKKRPPRRPVKKRPPRKPVKGRPPKKPKKRKPRGPSVLPVPPIDLEGPGKAEKKILDHMALVMDHLATFEASLDLRMKAFINADRTVDGEVRISELLDHWRTEEGFPELMEVLSRVLRQVGTIVPGKEGGAYWISIGVRFGPQSDAEMGDLAEMYKRYRGMFQVASYPLDASMKGGLQNAIVAFGAIVRSLMQKRGLPPAVVFIRYTWTPDGSRPGRYEGERGGGK